MPKTGQKKKKRTLKGTPKTGQKKKKRTLKGTPKTGQKKKTPKTGQQRNHEEGDYGDDEEFWEQGWPELLGPFGDLLDEAFWALPPEFFGDRPEEDAEDEDQDEEQRREAELRLAVQDLLELIQRDRQRAEEEEAQPEEMNHEEGDYEDDDQDFWDQAWAELPGLDQTTTKLRLD